MTTLITGGCGYIGSHTLVNLLEQQPQRDVLVLDNLSNSSETALQRVSELVGRPIELVVGDIRDKDTLTRLLKQNQVDTVIHFAGLKAVGESVNQPLDYYSNNVYGSLVLLEAMQEVGVNKLIFSSSATVYGTPKQLPITEQAPTGGIMNPYGRTKWHIEHILQDVCTAIPDFTAISLRYFNPVGAHSSGRIGEDPKDTPNNLMPYITQVAVGRRPRLTVFGDDYDTIDGTGVRDYIHVMDLAAGHSAALERLSQIGAGFHAINLGTGRGYSVLEIIRAFEAASGQRIDYGIGPRRSGDIASCYAANDKARQLLNWQATRGLDEMCTDAWHWQQNNPNGYT
ncbi:UDP-glucose 4-epimerase [Saliniradius amylolyticus]|uniref:UDP-glucose 4-epimerase n=1 Tax=Saliniradius amylolyticus TaxID=2183582 RepID=A0A2S2E3T1_9ALTE|nr:UDP-glucose 4-epimerase GalE [Saliniradius amylolyticus]AWL11677.1 UDP-glucose 4-epimerase [Saliniradius amylolyticus]